jgi:hypothetical protein
MQISIETIPHDCQRYDTVGDWQFDSEGGLLINISDTGSPLFNQLIAIHELVEALLCHKDGVTDEVVDDWDRAHLDSSDPGSIYECPYYEQHLTATIIERLMARELGVDWRAYADTVNSLGEPCM